jgi:molybdenum cofactor synthesis domain-containing protein
VEAAVFVPDHGLEHDAHAGPGGRQVSLLSFERIEAFRRKGAEAPAGCFGENLVVRGLDFASLPTGVRLRCGNALLELTSIGKECHSPCGIFHRMGECIMPTHGVFAKVLRGGIVRPGDKLLLEGPAPVRPYTTAVLTLSDTGYAGARQDSGGREVINALLEGGYRVGWYALLPDEADRISAELLRLCDTDTADLILTTGGTGFSPRDLTPEATLAVLERLCPGIPEAMRAYSLSISKRAMLSRAVAGIRGKTLIVNLPGSPRAVRECLGHILDTLEHGLDILVGRAKECASAPEAGHARENGCL